jgi:EamA domain-containing membrane protein RarD
MSTKIPLAGIGYGLIAYLIWGFFPLYFRQLGHITPMDILSNRTLWAFVFVALLLTLRQPRLFPDAAGQCAARPAGAQGAVEPQGMAGHRPGRRRRRQ